MKTTTIELGSGEDLITVTPAAERENNFILIHRHYEPALQMWGNFCSRIVTKLYNYSEAGGKIRWYHEKLYKFCYAQYDKYGDYFRLIDVTYTTDQDRIYEVE